MEHLLDIISTNQGLATLVLILAFLTPGFVAVRTYSLIIPSRPMVIASQVYDVLVYSFISYASASWVLVLALTVEGIGASAVGLTLGTAYVLFLHPALVAIAVAKLREQTWVQRHFVHPYSSAWDYVFSRRQSMWIIAHLNNGTKVAGWYSTNSFTSTRTSPYEIYIEKLWKLDENENFIAPVGQSAGALLQLEDIYALEFFDADDE